MINETVLSQNSRDDTAQKHSGTYLVFEFTGKLYGVNALKLKESIRLPELTPVDDEPDYIVGILNLRGRVVPVMDINLRMGRQTQSYSIDHCVVVLHDENRLLGLMATDLVKLSRYTQEQVEPLQHSESNDAQGDNSINFCVQGVAKDQEDLVVILDPTILFQTARHQPMSTKEEVAAPLLLPGQFCPGADAEQREIFLARRKRLMQHTQVAGTGESTPMAILRMGQVFLGIDLNLIRGFACARRITPIPCCPPHIIGNINLRGEILTVVDLRGLLRLPVTNRPDYFQVLVAQINGIKAAVFIDNIEDVIQLEKEVAVQAPIVGSAMTEDYIRGAAIYQEKMINIIDLKHIFTSGLLVVDHETTL